ncbi:hypothetical protein L596_025777 [Steinernema carpocapsae]|uniref:Uncharacterized protein n=1 Tax=Steinernema carpocapsae TaxID=34508 RepID=A0A4U5M8V5_STECR|nr:hypothetical protein L596_025777 [Steinernema carpocapsae]
MPRNLGYYEFDDWAFFRDENHDLRFWWNCVDKKCANKCKFGRYGHTNFQIHGLLHPYKCESEKWNGKQLVD